MSGRIQLLTFSRCLSSTCQGLDEFYGRMAARSLVFENHYLQRPFVQCPFEALGGDGSFARLRSMALAGELSARMVLIGDVSEEQPRQLPDWLNVSTAANADAGGAIDLVCEQLAQVSTPFFLWVHVVVPPEVDAEQFSELITQAEGTGTDRNDVLIVTFLDGGAVCQPDRFQSLLFEDDVRVPLWIQSSHPPVRVQSLTGSYDIAATLADELEDADCQLSSLKAENCAVNLLRTAEDPGRKQDRHLFVTADGVAAVRTSDFFFVQKEGELETASALYVKPEDVWNLNDVSAEYHEVVEELRNLLLPDGSGADGVTQSGPM
jgi:hypothetical protein